MGIKTAIEYCDSTTNPVMGCDGCELWMPELGVKVCYAMRQVEMRAGRKGWPPSVAEPGIFPERIEEAIAWPDLTGAKRPDKPWLNGYPRVVFLGDMGDMFCESVVRKLGGPDSALAFWPIEEMEKSPHVWLWLTKRPRVMRRAFERLGRVPENFWLGTTVTTRSTLFRLEELARIQEIPPHANVVWVSLEPLLEDIGGDWLWETRAVGYGPGPDDWDYDLSVRDDVPWWIVLGGRSGPGSNPMPTGRALEVIEECESAGIPVFLKQLGGPRKVDGAWGGRQIDGQTWNRMPEIIK